MSAPSNVAGIVRGFAAFDLLATLPFALPGAERLAIAAIYALGRALGSDAVAPPLEPLHLLFVNLTGMLAVVWAIARIRRPEADLGHLDGVARAVVGTVLLAYVAGGGVTPALLLFVVSEYVGAAVQLVRCRPA